MNPMTIRIFDGTNGKIVMKFLDMCTTASSTAEVIYDVIDGKLSDLLSCINPWAECISVSVDISVNIGIRNSLKSRILQRNSAIYYNGCPCHVLHNAAQKAGNTFAAYCRFDADEFAVNLYLLV